MKIDWDKILCFLIKISVWLIIVDGICFDIFYGERLWGEGIVVFVLIMWLFLYIIWVVFIIFFFV